MFVFMVCLPRSPPFFPKFLKEKWLPSSYQTDNGKMAQQLTALSALKEDLSQIPSTHSRGFTTTCDFNSNGTHALLGSLRTLHSYTHTHRHTDTHEYK